MKCVLASLAVTEWLGAAAAALSVIGYVYRAAKGLLRQVEKVLLAVAENSQQNRQLLARMDRVEGSVLGVQAEQSRQRREGSPQVRELVRTVTEQVVPKLENVEAKVDEANGD